MVLIIHAKVVDGGGKGEGNRGGLGGECDAVVGSCMWGPPELKIGSHCLFENLQ